METHATKMIFKKNKGSLQNKNKQNLGHCPTLWWPPHPDTLIDSDRSVYNSKSLFDFGPFKDQQLEKYKPFKDQIH